MSESRRVLDTSVSETPTSELMRQARAIRDNAYGSRVTYSPKVFIPLIDSFKPVLDVERREDKFEIIMLLVEIASVYATFNAFLNS